MYILHIVVIVFVHEIGNCNCCKDGAYEKDQCLKKVISALRNVKNNQHLKHDIAKISLMLENAET